MSQSVTMFLKKFILITKINMCFFFQDIQNILSTWKDARFL